MYGEVHVHQLASKEIQSVEVDISTLTGGGLKLTLLSKATCN